MKSSVLRVTSEYPSANVNLPDVLQTIPDPDAQSMLLVGDTVRWNKGICGSWVAQLIHDGLTSEFVTFGYKYDATEADRWLKLLPFDNKHVGKYLVTIRITYTDPDYAAIFTDVKVNIEVLPCEIK